LVLYELPSLPEERLVDVIARLAAAIVSDSCADAVWAGDPLSETATVKVAVPPEVAVPEMLPEDERVRPAGRLPEASDHV
jgi:hypothetical protein